MTDLRAIRKQLGFNQAEFAIPMGYSTREALTRAEKDGGSEQARRLAKMFARHGIPPEWLPPTVSG